MCEDKMIGPMNQRGRNEKVKNLEKNYEGKTMKVTDKTEER